MKDKQTNKGLDLNDKTPLEIITLCGKVKFSTEKTLEVLSGLPGIKNMEFLEENINTPGTEEYKAYRSGISQGDLEIESAMYDQAAAGDKDGYESLTKAQRTRAINDKLKDSFGLGDEE